MGSQLTVFSAPHLPEAAGERDREVPVATVELWRWEDGGMDGLDCW